MKLVASLVLPSLVAATIPFPQQILQGAKSSSRASAKQLESIWKQFQDLPAEAAQLWQEVHELYPEAVAKLELLSQPKPSKRRPDSEWDHILRGRDVQSVWVEGADGVKHRDVDGKLEEYDLRVKKVDPSALGVDPDVTQYSGYLDDNENDKHLFYCEIRPCQSHLVAE